MTPILTQTGALFLDAYRDLNAKKMFWIVLVISCLVVASFAVVGINARGFTILWFEIQSVFNTGVIPKPTFYKIMFSTLGVGWWLNWFAIILALVSTAGIMPDFIAGGAVDLYLSKPISRLRLFLTKYLTGLLFVTLQVALFTTACFFLIGARAGSWDLRVFLAVPVVALVFSYLFCVCTLIGLLTRSTVAALLLTILFWLMIFGVHSSESLLLMSKTAGRIETQAYENQFSYLDKEEAMYKERIAQADPKAQAQLDATRKRRRELEDKKKASDPTRRNIATAHRALYAVKTILPKTAETSALLARWLNVAETAADEEKLDERDRRRAARNGANGWFSGFRDRTEVRMDDSEVIRESEDIINARPVSWVMGTSIAFEAVILALSAWIFCRRDY
ncbi:MAG TPA: ABC transporter permease [Tepidisphaeraceae bacterium]